MGIDFNGNVDKNLFVNLFGKKETTHTEKTDKKPVENVPVGQTQKTADASALEAIGWQNMGLHLNNKVDTSPKAVEARVTNTLAGITPILDREFNPQKTDGDELAEALQAFIPKGYDTPEARQSIAVHIHQFESLV